MCVCVCVSVCLCVCVCVCVYEESSFYFEVIHLLLLNEELLWTFNIPCKIDHLSYFLFVLIIQLVLSANVSVLPLFLFRSLKSMIILNLSYFFILFWHRTGFSPLPIYYIVLH